MTIRLCNRDEDFDAWDEFLVRCPNGHFLQLHGWLSSFESMGFECEVMVQSDGGRIVGGAAFLSTKVPLLPARIFLMPHGPVCEDPDGPAWNELTEALDAHFRERGALYVQAWPQLEVDDEVGLERYRRAGYRGPQLLHVQEFIATRLAIDLAGRSEEEILAPARRETRRYCRKSQRTGLELRLGTTHADLVESHQVWKENAEHHGYAVRPFASCEIVMDRLVNKGKGLLIQAWKDDDLAGSMMVLFAGGVASYAVAAGTRRALSSCYPAEFMHLAAIRVAKERGMAMYDLNDWGAKGIAQFKRGFRPKVCAWAEPITKVYRPMPTRLITWGDSHLRLLLRKLAARRHRGR